jgi:hypothetical protein
MTTAETPIISPNTPLRRRAVLATLLGTALAVSAAGHSGAARADAAPNLVDLQVVNRDTGQPLRTWPHAGRTFVAGQPGARYGLRVTNHTDGRVLVVMSVDGLNVVTGETAGYGQRGYVLGPYEAYDVTGWRKSESEVAAFTFAPLPQSYAARTGRRGDVGVIGLAVFKERVVLAPAALPAAEPRREPRIGDRSSISETVLTGQRIPSPSTVAAAPPAVARAAPLLRPAAPAPAEEKLGTAHGARETSVITLVSFDRATAYPQLIRRIEYDTFDNLVASGVIRPASDPGHRPRPFPANGYVPDPPGDR